MELVACIIIFCRLRGDLVLSYTASMPSSAHPSINVFSEQFMQVMLQSFPLSGELG